MLGVDWSMYASGVPLLIRSRTGVAYSTTKLSNFLVVFFSVVALFQVPLFAFIFLFWIRSYSTVTAKCVYYLFVYV